MCFTKEHYKQTFILDHKKVCHEKNDFFYLFSWASQEKKITNNTHGEWSKLEKPHEKCKKISQEFIQWPYLGCFHHFVMEFISNNFSFFHQTLVLFSCVNKLNTTYWETSVTAQVKRYKIKQENEFTCFLYFCFSLWDEKKASHKFNNIYLTLFSSDNNSLTGSNYSLQMWDHF